MNPLSKRDSAFSVCSWGLFFILLFMVSCSQDERIIATSTTETFLATFTPTLTPSQTPPPISSTYTHTATATATSVPTTTAAPTLTATSTVIPTFSPPPSSIVFVQDNALQKWEPQTNEVQILAEDVYLWAQYFSNIALFLREVVSNEEYSLVVFHIPTQTEVIVARLYAGAFFTPDTVIYVPPPRSAFSISPDGKWLGYATTPGGTEREVTLFVQEIVANEQGLTVSSPVLTRQPIQLSSLENIDITWPTQNQISWRDSEGIWVAELAGNPIEPVVAIQPSTNTFPGLYCGDENEVKPCLWGTTYLPAAWSPDGRYLLVIDYGYEGGVWYVIESVTNRSYELPNSYFGVGGDTFIWLDSTNLAQFTVDAQVKIWQIHPDDDQFIFLVTTIPLKFSYSSDYYGLVTTEEGHLRFASSALSGPAIMAVYDLNLETGALLKLSPEVSQREIVIYWSPDRQYVLSWESSISQILLFDLQSKQFLEMSAVLGSDSCCLYWYEETR